MSQLVLELSSNVQFDSCTKKMFNSVHVLFCHVSMFPKALILFNLYIDSATMNK